jgi:hypothetical protein
MYTKNAIWQPIWEISRICLMLTELRCANIMAAGQCGEGQKRDTDAGVLRRHGSCSPRGGRGACAVPLAGHRESKICELHISWNCSKTCTKWVGRQERNEAGADGLCVMCIYPKMALASSSLPCPVALMVSVICASSDLQCSVKLKGGPVISRVSLRPPTWIWWSSASQLARAGFR